MALTHDERMALAYKLNADWVANKKAAVIVTRDMIRNNTITAQEIESLIDLYPMWEKVGMNYSIDDLVSYNGVLYQVIQAHTSQVDWTPDAVPALFESKAPAGVIPEWAQPTGSTDAYNIGDKVTFEGVVYDSLINANTWSPTVYPAGWQEVIQ